MTNFLDRIRKPAGEEAEKTIQPPATSAPAVEIDSAPAKSAKPPVFSADTDALPDALGIAPAIRGLAELSSHAKTQTPLAIGVFGSAGSGKSFAVHRLITDIRAIADAASGRKEAPFLGRIVAARVDAASYSEPAIALASAVHTALHAKSPHRAAFAAWAEDATFNSGDPQQVIREAGERLGDLRRRHDSEKEALQEINTRRDRLIDNVLYDAAGTRIDSYARNNRTGIENRLTGFGFTGPDPIATYKDLVRDYSEHGGIVRRVSVFLHSLWAFRGQTRLILLAILFVALAWLMAQGEAPQATWLTNMLANLQDRFAAFKATSDWITDNTALFTLLKHTALWAAAGAIALNIFRAIRFLMPIRRGVTLLHADVDARRRDLDGLITTQSKRVEDLGGEIEKHTRQLSQAERRADAARDAAGSAERSPFHAGSDGLEGRARSFLQAISVSLNKTDSRNAPQRLILAIDNLDALSPAKAASFIQQTQSLLSGKGIVRIIAIDPAYLKTGLGALAESPSGLSDDRFDAAAARLVDIPLRLDKRMVTDFSGLVRTMVDKAEGTAAAAPDATFSALDEPMRPGETELLTALSSIAGKTPRDIKHFVNVYRLIRNQTSAFAPLALILAVESGGTAEERGLIDTLISGGNDTPVNVPQDGSRIAMAVQAASIAQSSSVTGNALREAQTIAAMYSGRF